MARGWRDQIEPAALSTFDRSVSSTSHVGQSEANVSIAISLKRIADALGDGGANKFHDTLINAAWEAGQAFERGRQAA